MAGLNKILVVAVIVHVALFGATIFLTNAISDLPYHGGDHGFLPSTGNSSNTYDRFSAWLSGGGRDQEYEEPDAEGGIAILGWIIKGPICSTVSIVKFMLSMTILKYGIIDMIPNMGFGLWFKTVIHLVAALIHVGLVSVLVGFAVRAGVFSNHPPDGGAGADLRVRHRVHPAQRRRCIVLWLIRTKTRHSMTRPPKPDRPRTRAPKRAQRAWTP